MDDPLSELCARFGPIMVANPADVEAQVRIDAVVCCDDDCPASCCSGEAGDRLTDDCHGCGRRLYYRAEVSADTPKFCKECAVARIAAAEADGKQVKAIVSPEWANSAMAEAGAGFKLPAGDEVGRQAIDLILSAIGADKLGVAIEPDDAIEGSGGSVELISCASEPLPGYVRATCDGCYCRVYHDESITDPEVRRYCRRCVQARLPSIRQQAEKGGKFVMPVMRPEVFQQIYRQAREVVERRRRETH